jgi:ParB-like chromosome segregation protein Spo0J
MKTITCKVLELSNDPANARKHSERNIESIMASLRRFGQQKPIVIDSTNVVRAGNGTLEAAKRLGWDTIEAVKTTLKGSDAIAYAIADNRTSELAEWDSDVLAAQLNGLLADDEVLLLASGFTQAELYAMIGEVASIEDELNEGLPDYDGSPVGSSTIIVHFATPEDRCSFSRVLNVKVTEKAKFVWYPEKPKT